MFMSRHYSLVGDVMSQIARGSYQEKAGLAVEELTELLNTGVSVETLLNLICFRLEVSGECEHQTQ